MAKNRISIVFDPTMNIDNISREVQKIKGLLDGVKLPDAVTQKLVNSYENLNQVLREYQELSKKPISSKDDLNVLEKTIRSVENEYTDLIQVLNSLSKISKKVALPQLMTAEQNKSYAALRNVIEGINNQLNQLTVRKKALEGTQEALDTYARKASKLKEAEGYLAGAMVNPKKNQEKIVTLQNQVATLKEDLKALSAQDLNIKPNENAFSALTRVGQEIRAIQRQIDESAVSFKNFQDIFDANQWDLSQLENLFDIDVSKIQGIKDLKIVYDEIEEKLRAGIVPDSAQVVSLFNNADKIIKSMHDSEKAIGKDLESQLDVQEQINSAAQRALAFFSVGNTFQVFKQIIRGARDSIQELDAVMTETAVVTNYSIGDMWKKLPEYTALANKLGATVKGAYETMTLFYQQGMSNIDFY